MLIIKHTQNQNATAFSRRSVLTRTNDYKDILA